MFWILFLINTLNFTLHDAIKYNIDTKKAEDDLQYSTYWLYCNHAKEQEVQKMNYRRGIIHGIAWNQLAMRSTCNIVTLLSSL
jgi:hypothetical protein